MKTQRVKLNKEEAAWLARNTLKTKTILEAASKKDPETLERKTYKTVCKLAGDARDIQNALDSFGDNPFEIELLLQRSTKSVAGDMIEATIKTLESVIIPEYVRRGPEYTTYLDEAKAKVGMLKTLRRKFK